MIIVRLNGGLGNQLFQYATARRLSYFNQAQLFLDTFSFKRDPLREYSLTPYNFSPFFVSFKKVAIFYAPARFRKVQHFLYKRIPFTRYKWVKQHSLRFDPEVLTLKGDIYLDGYWQSEKYFKDIATLIRHEFTLKMPPEGKNAEFADYIQSLTAVSLHIRRGDYVTNPHTASVHGLCSLEYYREAANRGQQRGQASKIEVNNHP